MRNYRWWTRVLGLGAAVLQVSRWIFVSAPRILVHLLGSGLVNRVISRACVGEDCNQSPATILLRKKRWLCFAIEYPSLSRPWASLEDLNGRRLINLTFSQKCVRTLSFQITYAAKNFTRLLSSLNRQDAQCRSPANDGVVFWSYNGLDFSMAANSHYPARRCYQRRSSPPFEAIDGVHQVLGVKPLRQIHQLSTSSVRVHQAGFQLPNYLITSCLRLILRILLCSTT
jgi:hypothetical protein